MSTDPYRVWPQAEYTVLILEGGDGLDIWDDNVDVEVHLLNGVRFGATFFTLRNIESLMSRWAGTGECAHGLYFNAANALIVRQLIPEVILAVISDLHQSGELSLWFQQLEDDVPDETP